MTMNSTAVIIRIIVAVEEVLNYEHEFVKSIISIKNLYNNNLIGKLYSGVCAIWTHSLLELSVC